MGRIRVGFFVSMVALIVVTGLLPAQARDTAAASGAAEGGFQGIGGAIATALGSAALAVFAAYLKFRWDLAQFKLYFLDQIQDDKIITTIRNHGRFINEDEHKSAVAWLHKHDKDFADAGNRLERTVEQLTGMSARATRHGEQLDTALAHLQLHEVTFAEMRAELRGLNAAFADLRSRVDFVPNQFRTKLDGIEESLLEISEAVGKLKPQDLEARIKSAEEWASRAQRQILEEPPP